MPNAYCSGAWVSIGANSCNVPGSCLYLAGVTIGTNSCNGSDACEYAAGLIENNSCNGDYACYSGWLRAAALWSVTVRVTPNMPVRMLGKTMALPTSVTSRVMNTTPVTKLGTIDGNFVAYPDSCNSEYACDDAGNKTASPRSSSIRVTTTKVVKTPGTMVSPALVLIRVTATNPVTTLDTRRLRCDRRIARVSAARPVSTLEKTVAIAVIAAGNSISSCNGYEACYEAADDRGLIAIIGHFSCDGFEACYEAAGIITSISARSRVTTTSPVTRLA